MASGRLKALLQTKQAGATRNATAQQPLLHVASPRECNTQQCTEQVAELLRLVDRVALAYAFTPEERAEAAQNALKDQIAAFECFGALLTRDHR